MKLIIDDKAHNKMVKHAEEDYPNECCGFFYGLESDERHVTAISKVENAKEGDQRRRFQIDPLDYQKAEQYADEHGVQLLGVYHSHPDHPAKPSEHDRSVALPWFSYIIISVKEGDAAATRSWQLNSNRQFEEESVTIKEFSTQSTTTE